MASKEGQFDLKVFGADRSVPHHKPNAAKPGLPLKAAEIIYAGCLIAWDAANSQALSAITSQDATAKVIGWATETVDNQLGAKGDLTIKPVSGICRVKNDGNLTAAHLFKQVRVIDDHTVGVPAATDADRIAGQLVALDDDASHVWILVTPETAHRAPQTVTLTSTNGTAAAAADLAALKVETEKIGDDVRAVHAALAALNLIATAA